MSFTKEQQSFLDMLDNATPKFLGAVRSKIGGFGGTISKMTGGVEIKPFGGLFGEATSQQEAAVQRQADLLRNLGDAQRFVAEAAKELTIDSLEMFGSVKEGNEAIKVLGANMRTFAFMTKDVQVELGKATMVLDAFGVNMGTTSEILDTAAMAFGASQQELQGLATGLAETVYKFPGQAQQIARNFQAAQSSLAYDSGKIMQVFKKLQETSSNTGVSFNDLTNAFGDSMDTFEGSANKAGSLNAILGRSVFNSIDLLGKTEAQRVDTIVQGVRQSIGGDVNRLGKFQLKAVAQGMGLSVEQTRRLLTGQATAEDIALEDPKAKLQDASKKAMDDNTMSLKELTTEMKLFRTIRSNAAMEFNTRQLDTALKTTRTGLGFIGKNVFGMSENDAQDLAGSLKAPEELITRVEQFFLRGQEGFTMTKEQFDEVRREAGATGKPLEQLLVGKARAEMIADAQTILDDVSGKVPESVKNAFRLVARKLKIEDLVLGEPETPEPDPDKPDPDKDGNDISLRSIYNLFASGKAKLEITGLDGGILKGLLKGVKVPP